MQRFIIMRSIGELLQKKSGETFFHSRRLLKLSRSLGERVGLSENTLEDLELLAMLHDVGKLMIGRSLLEKTDALSEADWRKLREHPEHGYRIVAAIPELAHVAEFILYHHERWDGTGYPIELSGEDIPLLSRIISVVDAYDAMTNNRVYRKGISPRKAKIELYKNAGSQFDPALVAVFLEILKDHDA